ncbi:MAG: valine--tRNA ligase [Oscillospiraceae bacterium]|jgi:valyl-tRNA synthetase|nr:valine--tRNA ligase [Oscillospiraceae bacterium]
MAKELAKQYNPAESEDKLYKFWEDSGYFTARRDEGKKPYTIVIPPPNITGQLHMGHALDNTLQDILIRWRRMQGYDALWLPGTDHAAISTEVKVVEALAKEGIGKADLGREKFLERVWDWKRIYGGRIVEQLKKLGSSCDWSRERFTLDDGCSKAVVEVFNRLYEKGLLYRGERIINWCPHCMTTLSDAEVEYAEHDGNFWHLRYPLADGSGYLELATTRPETMLGDTAIAVHPDDDRYAHLVGKTVILPLVGREIPIVADSYVERDFGTGVVKITPAHDPNDFEVGRRHSLPIINIMNDDGSMNAKAGEYAGLDRYECRKQIIAALDQQGFLVKVEPMKHNVGAHDRCHTVVEPMVSLQWFVKMEELAQPAIDLVKNGDTKFVPDRFSKVYYHWLENIRDWCVSRQIWWGHRIPAWYCAHCGEITVSRGTPPACPHCGSSNIKQDEDTLDTWFSSALWPFSTLGWPDNTPDFAHYYPTSTLVTGYDIIFFWVVRMMFSAAEYTGKAPFSTVFIHGIIRDAQGRKMSKSLGNGIDPLEEIAKYGADALRFTLATGNSPGNDMRYSEEKVSASRNFANKLWNAARFALMYLGDETLPQGLPGNLTLDDKWILSRLNALTREVTENLEKFELGLAVQKLYDFLWDELCDWYIELAKIRLNAGGKAKTDTLRVLCHTLNAAVRLLHPFMPFITEEIWQALPHIGDTIMLAPFPEYSAELDFSAAEAEMARLMEAIRALRSRRAEMNVPPSKRAKLYIQTEQRETFTRGVDFLQKLAGVSDVLWDETPPADAVQVVTADAVLFIPLGDLVDLDAERARLGKELEQTQKLLAGVQAKLGNAEFSSRAPAHIVQQQRDTAAALEQKISLLADSLLNLGS